MGIIRSRSNCIIIENIRFADDVTKLGQGKFAYAEGSRKNIDTPGSYTPDTGPTGGKRNRRDKEQASEVVGVEEL